MKATITLIIIFIFGFLSVTNAQISQEEEHNYIPLIDRLELNESYNITIRSVGCFNNTAKTLTIYRNEHDLIATLNDTTINLNPSKKEALRNFEIDLKKISVAGCSTIDTYILKYRNKSSTYRDASCSNFYAKSLLQKLGFSN
ncbi:hypothetical protein JQC67_17755 [Aurantibacter crassamenti]|uniref:hypothetical protein n=1 Tax=Aurantibacter crassamenti TaxID=1837375 RepID=UPI00193A8B6D|nr:hypothetical protein [Aurantibacter crassamenti]MBM1108001.1 hypothetical protein [Aurantibacter crassamenti]